MYCARCKQENLVTFVLNYTSRYFKELHKKAEVPGSNWLSLSKILNSVCELKIAVFFFFNLSIYSCTKPDYMNVSQYLKNYYFYHSLQETEFNKKK